VKKVLVKILLSFCGLLIAATLIAEPKNIYNAAKKGEIQSIKSNVESGFDINSKDEFGKTLLMYSCYYGHIEIVEYLILKKVEINIQDNENWSALFYSVSKNRVDITAILLKNGADTTLKDIDGKTAFDYAVSKNNQKILKMFEIK